MLHSQQVEGILNSVPVGAASRQTELSFFVAGNSVTPE